MAINTKLDILVQGPLMNAGYFKHEEYSTLTDLIKILSLQIIYIPLLQF